MEIVIYGFLGMMVVALICMVVGSFLEDDKINGDEVREEEGSVESGNATSIQDFTK